MQAAAQLPRQLLSRWWYREAAEMPKSKRCKPSAACFQCLANAAACVTDILSCSSLSVQE